MGVTASTNGVADAQTTAAPAGDLFNTVTDAAHSRPTSTCEIRSASPRAGSHRASDKIYGALTVLN